MNERTTRKTAILVDGGFYKVRSTLLWGKKSPEERANELFSYCLKHINEPEEPRDLYRIFYYDCPPMAKKMFHPLSKREVDYSLSSGYKWSNDFFAALSSKRKVALRRGELAEAQAAYILKPESLSKLLSGATTVALLSENDFKLEVKQKGVDMKIGLDVASLAQGRYVDQIILIAGDSDFVPVAKMARRNGIDFILDPLKQFPKKLLLEHVDGIESFI